MNHKLLTDLLNAGEDVVADLQEDLRKENKTAFKVSDVTDESGQYQYVNLVQEGGGVLGIALLGYTYVLERMGIRFLKLAGTSAGAINTMMLSAIQSESIDQLKSPVILHYLSKKNLFDFVDGHPIARWLIRNVVVYTNYLAKTINSIVYTLLVSIALLVVSSILLWQSTSSTLALLLWIGLGVAGMYIIFSKGKISNGIVSRFIGSADFLKILTPALLLIGGCYGLGKLAADDRMESWQLLVEWVPIALLMAYSFYKAQSNNYLRFIQNSVGATLLIILILCLTNRYYPEPIYDGLQHTLNVARPGRLAPYTYLSVAGISLFLFFVLNIVSILFLLSTRFSGSHFGINPGRKFRDWMADLLEDGAVTDGQDGPILITTKTGATIPIHNRKNNIKTMRDFIDVISTMPKLRYVGNDPRVTLDDLMQYDENKPPVTFITAEITTQNKIELPRMWRLFWPSEHSICPADFVRASMSIPVFFEAFRVKNIPKQHGPWNSLLGFHGNPPQDAVFMDGGILSNFPINLFYQANIKTPRMPTFGVRLDDHDGHTSSEFDSFGSLVMSMFNTSRYYYDKDFLITHPQYHKSIGSIDVREFNWLNFDIKNEEKLRLFRKGADAAAQFLRDFNWEDYKAKRKDFRKGRIGVPTPATATPPPVTQRIWPKPDAAVHPAPDLSARPTVAGDE